MLDQFTRLCLGLARCEAPLLARDVAGLQTPDRPPHWLRRGDRKCRSINGKAAFDEPFFNHLAGHTQLLRAA